MSFLSPQPPNSSEECGAERHNATAWRAKECRCDLGREDHNRIARLARKEKELGRPRRVPAAPVQRMVRDLMAAGWPARELAPRIGWKCGELHTLFSRRWLHRDTAERITAVYADLHAVAGPSELTRRRAAKADLWLPPVTVDRDAIDPVAVQRFAAGEDVPLNRAEKYAAWIAMRDAGVTGNEAQRRLHLSGQTVSAFIARSVSTKEATG